MTLLEGDVGNSKMTYTKGLKGQNINSMLQERTQYGMS
jgi:hypothetical protein